MINLKLFLTLGYMDIRFPIEGRAIAKGMTSQFGEIVVNPNLFNAQINESLPHSSGRTKGNRNTMTAEIISSRPAYKKIGPVHFIAQPAKA